jgi:4-amino-4-deoxy-L-arabinose transferase-like glycosyltransferase
MGRQHTGRRKRTRAPAPRSESWDWRLPAFLTGVFALKLTALLQLKDHPLLQPDAGLDTAAYFQLAERVLGGDHFLGPGLYYLSPLYIYFLAATLAVGGSLTMVRVVQIAMGTAAVGFIFLTARDWFGRRAAWLAAALAALSGVFTFYEIVLFQSSLDPFLTSAALYCLSRGLLPPEGGSHEIANKSAGSSSTPRVASASTAPVASAFRRKDLLLAGAIFGLQFLNRPNVIVAIAGIALTLVLVRRWRAAAILAAGVMMALAPVVARNLLVSKQPALSSSQGGLNFYIGNREAATGQYESIPGVRANIEGQSEDTRRVAEAAAGRPLTDAEVSSYFFGRATQWMRDHPGRALALLGRKLALTFNARHQWLDLSYPYYAYDTGSMLRFLFVGPWLLGPLGLTGLFVAAPASRRAPYLAWASFVPFYAVGVAVFFVAERYRLPLLAALCATGGAALDRAIGFLQAGEARDTTPRRIALPIVVFAMSAVLTAWPFDVPDGRYQERLRLSKVLMNRGDYGGAALELERALALAPGETGTEFNLGMALVSAGRPQDGIGHIRHAVDAGVPIDGARYALANVLLRTGDRAGAVALLRSYSPLPSDSADSCYQVAILALDAEAPVVAERYLKRALELRPGWPEAVEALRAATSRIPR